MKRTITLSFFLLLMAGYYSSAQNQDIYLPKEYKRALKNKTRSISGAPGRDYYQNRADYVIEASFNPQTRVLTGSETITYINHSPDSLKALLLNIDHDLFKRGARRVSEVEPEDLTAGVDITYASLNGIEIPLSRPNWRRDGTELVLRLGKAMAIAPEGKASLVLRWSLVHPLKTQLRTGTYDSLSFFIGYWYPRIAVYDDVFGWDYTQHLGSAEFYNDFGNYDVTLTLPGNYLMWATGELQNSVDLFQDQILVRLKSADESNKTTSIVRAQDLAEKAVLKPGDQKKWHYTAENVSDFAFGLSCVYLWDQQVLSFPDGQKVKINAAYPGKAADFREVPSIGAKSIEMMSDELTGYRYPFPSMTVFCGEGGMEFPMIVNDGSSDSRKFTVFVTAHEIGHSWFPFIAGVNETRYGWIDEGLITVLPKKVEQFYFPDTDPNRNYMQSYSQWAGREDDLTMSVPSNSIAEVTSYTENVYARAAAAFYHLGDAIGDSRFTTALHTFLSEWAFRHPSPYDLMNTFSRVAGEDLSWYFNPWFYENGYPDLAIGKVKTEGNQTSIQVLKNGSIPVPVRLKITFDDGSTQPYSASCRTWKNSTGKLDVTLSGTKKPVSIELGNPDIPDAYPADNNWTADRGNQQIPEP